MVLGGVVKLTVSWVAVAEVTVPAAPRLNLTVLLPAVVSNPVPSIVKVVAFMARLAFDGFTVGGGGTTVTVKITGPPFPNVYVYTPGFNPREPID